MTDIKPGDHVRITIEGPWHDNEYQTTEQIAAIRKYAVYPNDTVTVEKVEPPVETFGPGDLLRNKDNPDLVIAVTLDGYTYVGTVNPGLHVVGAGHTPATSQSWERVEI